MTIREVTQPTAEPISVAEAKLHARITTSAEDVLVRAWISAARERAETYTGLALVTRIFEVLLDSFPQAIPLPGPVRSVISLKYLDQAGALQTLSTSSYTVDKYNSPAWLVPAHGFAWPVTWDDVNAVRVRYVRGMLVPFTADPNTDIVSAAGHGYGSGDEVTILAGDLTAPAVPAGLSDGGQYFAISADADTLKLSTTSAGSAIDITTAGTAPNFLGQMPFSIRAAMLLIIGHFDKNRVDAADAQVYPLPQGAEALLFSHRALRL